MGENLVATRDEMGQNEWQVKLQIPTGAPGVLYCPSNLLASICSASQQVIDEGAKTIPLNKALERSLFVWLTIPKFT